MVEPVLAERIAVKKAQLDELRPISARSLEELDRWYDVELTYSSNALEGNTLTRSETLIVLEKGITVSGKPLVDHLEATGHREALHFVRELARRGEPILEHDIRSIHRLILLRLDADEAGRYSRHQRMIAGSDLVLPSPAEIAPHMADFVRWLGSAPSSPQTAFDAHERFVTIHPFSDGNGRTGRLLMNLLLLRADYPPVIIRPEDRVPYLDTLHAVQTAGDRSGYDDFLFKQLEASLDRHLQVLRRARS